jgi:hypothetical protein|tara:strand:+ start:13828 stop:13998 length:171 start_codon:yes stop_codon:yes gene_type:complete
LKYHELYRGYYIAEIESDGTYDVLDEFYDLEDGTFKTKEEAKKCIDGYYEGLDTQL